MPSSPIYDGSEFARQGIVCVTVPYRLGVFGFLDLGPLLGSEYNGSANNALRDLIASLEWIQHNIAAFGGDPAGVTIGGESAGAKLTDTLMGTPSAQPLFHQMISESGGAERVWSQVDAIMVGNAYGRAWTTQTGQDIPSLKSAPRRLPHRRPARLSRQIPLPLPASRGGRWPTSPETPYRHHR